MLEYCALTSSGAVSYTWTVSDLLICHKGVILDLISLLEQLNIDLTIQAERVKPHSHLLDLLVDLNYSSSELNPWKRKLLSSKI